MAKYRSSASALAKIVERSPALVYLVDQRGEILFANPACEHWLGVESESLFGKTIRYCFDYSESANSSEESLHVLAPPPDVFADRGQLASPIRFLICSPIDHSATAPLRYRWVTAFPLHDPNLDEIAALVVSHGPDLSSKPDSLTEQEPAHQAHLTLMELRRQLPLIYRADALVGVSPFSNRLRRQTAMAAASNIDVYICGPSGSGKEFLARTIHASRQLAGNRELIPIHGSLADAEMIQSLFQALHQKKQQMARLMAMPGADPTGHQAAADALLLLNVDRLQPAAQVELCRQLAAGSPVEYVIATGERALSALLDGGEFHQELAGRLATMAIELVPLWQRAEDIPVLAQRMLERAHRKKPVAGFDAATLQLLTEYRWPGNLNQLQELVSQAGEHVQERLLTPEDLPKKFHDCLIAQRLAPSAERSIDLEKFLQSIERELILRAIGQAKGNKSQAAFLLGLSRAKLLRRIETLELFQEVERCFPGADSSMTENAAQHEASRVESKSASRTDGRSRLRDKLLKSPQPEELASKPDSLERENRNANDDEDRDWVTPDAFEEIE